jgi:uncharacterized protein
MRRNRPANLFDQFFVYHPEPWIERDWAKVSGLPLEEVWLSSEDGTRVFGWYAASAQAAPTLLWCHGNAGNLIHRLDNLALLHRAGLTVFIFDYRGYGRSAGKPTEEGLYQDARAAYRYVTESRHVPPGRLVIFGRSLGAAVAGTLVSQRPAAGLVLESPFPSVAAMAKEQSLGLLARILLHSRFPLIDRLKDIHVPVLVIHGDRDEIVPIRLGREVFDAARPPKSMYVVEGADHNDLYHVGGLAYLTRLKEFVTGVTGR